MIAEVIVDISNSQVDRIFDYIFENSEFNEHSTPSIGSRVLVPFANRLIEGFVVGIKDVSEYELSKLKRISKVVDDEPIFDQEMLQLARFMVESYHLRLIDTLRLFLPSEMRKSKVNDKIKHRITISPDFVNRDISEFIKPSSTSQADIFYYLLDNQYEYADEINKLFSNSALKNLLTRGILVSEDEHILRKPYSEEQANSISKICLTNEQRNVVNEISESNDMTFLLHGVTGSGKTEVYMHCISKILVLNKSAIMLVPEISLTPQVLRTFRARFGDYVAIIHSGLSAGERYDEWRRIQSGEAKVVVGARSAIFSPVKNLGLIIIDEEHDSSYISDSNPRYITVEIAEFRRKFNQCNLVLGSATPSIESYYFSQIGKYKLLALPNRINNRKLPQINIVNMCSEIMDGNNDVFSRKLEFELHNCMNNNNQAIVFINRRGYSSFVICKSCGYVAKCNQCDVSLVYHRDENVLKCHYCNNRFNALDICPECKSANIRRGYVGTQQVVEKLEKMFPDKKILRMDNDTTQTKDAHALILKEFYDKNASILVGTQMIAKGHDFPDVTLVGIVDADMSLHIPDFRSNERTFQLITQVSGRAGRDTKEGLVVLQTYAPKNYVYKFAVANDYLGFYNKECNLREVTKYPPFSKILRILVTSEIEELSLNALRSVFLELQTLVKEKPDAFAYFSAMKSPIKFIQSKFRNQILLRIVGIETVAIVHTVYKIVDKHLQKNVSIFIEINPNNLS